MNLDMDLGPVNGHIVGIVLKEMVRRAINGIRSKQHVFEVQKKESYSGEMDDLFTSADTEAQRLYLRSISECFPCAGVIAEEDSLRIEAKNGCSAYFTIDPLDGTKAFVRRQSHGIGSMIALVENGEVISAYIGDVKTQEIYGYRPGSSNVHRITEFNTSQHLDSGERMPLKEHYVLLRDPAHMYSPLSQALIYRGFKNQLVDGGSIGIWLARLWKREVGAALIPSGWETPWDSTPIIGISQKLGYKFLRPVEGDDKDLWQYFEPTVPQEKYKRSHDVLIIHGDDAPDFWNFAFK